MARVNTARDNLEDFKWYCENFLSVVVGKHEFGNNKKKKVVSKIATKSDEALVLIASLLWKLDWEVDVTIQRPRGNEQIWLVTDRVHTGEQPS